MMSIAMQIADAMQFMHMANIFLFTSSSKFINARRYPKVNKIHAKIDASKMSENVEKNNASLIHFETY